MKNKMLPLITDVVFLEAEEESKPVKQVIVRSPLAKRRTAEVTDGAKCCGGGTDFGETEGGMVGEEVVDWDDVVGLFLVRRS